MTRFTILALVTMVAMVTASHTFPECSSSVRRGHQCLESVFNLHPTQFALGYVEVQCKVGYYNSKSSLESYLHKEEHWVPAVRGPEGKYYITDHHHLCRAVMECDHPSSQKKIVVDIVEDWSSKSVDEFYAHLINHGYVWLYDEKGYNPMNPALLPTSLKQMPNDPYRGFAWIVQRAGGYQKTGAYYQQFQWANFYRVKMPMYQLPNITSVDPSDLPTNWTACAAQPFSSYCQEDETRFFLDNLRAAMHLARSASASYLPGFGPDESESVPHCGQDDRLSLVDTIDWMTVRT